MVVRGVPAGHPVAETVEARREQVALGRLLPELHAHLDALAEHAAVPAAHRPRLEEQRGRTGARQLVGHRRDRAAALVPPALGGVAHRQPVGHVAGGQRGQEVAASRRRHDDHRVRVEPAGGQHEPPVPADGRRGRGGQRPQGRRTRLGGRDAGRRRGLGQVAQRPRPQAVQHPARRERVGPALDRVAERPDPLPGQPLAVPALGAGQRRRAEAVAQVVVGGDAQHRGGECRLRRGRHEQPVDVVGDHLARAGRAVVRHRGHARRHRLLQHQRVPLAARGQHGHARARPLGGQVGGAAREQHPVLEAELAHLGGEVVGARPVAPDRQRPARHLLVDAPEGVDDVLELLLRREPARRDEALLVQRRTRLRRAGQRVRDDQQLGGGAAEAAGEPPRHRLGERHHDVGAGRELEQGAEVVDPRRGGAVLLVHQRHVGRRELGDDGEQLGGRGDQHVGVEVPEGLAHRGVGEAVVEGVPAAGDDHRLAVGQLVGVPAADRGGPRAAYVDEVGDLEPVDQRVVGRRAAPGDAEDADAVALAEPDDRVGLLDARACRAAHPVGVEEDEDDVEGTVAAGTSHRRPHLVAQCHVRLSPVSRSRRHDPRAWPRGL